MRPNYRRLKQILGLIVVLGAIIATIRFSTIQAQPEPSCLQLGMYDSITDEFFQVDLRTGQSKANYQDYDQIASLHHPDTTSADGTYTAYFDQFEEGGVGGVLSVGVRSLNKVRYIDAQEELEYGWSAKGHLIGYVWNNGSDQTDVLAVVDAAENNKRTQVIPENQLGDGSYAYFAGWSADNQYFAVKYLVNGLESPGITFSFVAVQDLTILPHHVIANLDYSQDMATQLAADFSWSPAGDRFAYVETNADNSQTHLVIGSPLNISEQKLTFMPGESGPNAMAPVWSADGQYVAVWTMQSDITGEYWVTNILGLDGTAYTNILSQKVGNGVDGGVPPTGWWVGNTYLFLRQKDTTFNSDSPISDLVAFHPDQNRYEIIASNVSGSLEHSADGGRVAVPYQNNGFNVDVMAADGTNRTNLVANVASISLWVWSGRNLAAVWHDLGAGVWLSWMNGNQKGTLDTTFDDISQVQWLDDGHSLFYVGKHNQVLLAGIIDTITNTSYVIADGLAPDAFDSNPYQQVNHIVQASHNIAIWTGLFDAQMRDHPPQKLLLTSTDTYQTHLIGDNILNPHDLHWSPDGTMLAYLTTDAQQQHEIINVISADGTKIKTISIPGFGITLYGWDWCH